MTIYVDEPRYQYGRMKMCHLTATTLDELHAFAKKLGLKPEWFQDHPRHPHYDICKFNRAKAIALGARPVQTREMLRRCFG